MEEMSEQFSSYPPQPAGGTASDDEHHALHHATAQAQGERGQECGGTTGTAEIPGVQFQQEPTAETAHFAEGLVAL
jgi:hypothetical protein